MISLTEMPVTPRIGDSSNNDPETKIPSKAGTHTTTSSTHYQSRRQITWQTVVVITCFFAYAFLYFCRDHIYVVEDGFKSKYLYPTNETKAKYYLSIMFSIGYVMVLIGKIFMSLVTDKYLKSGMTPLILCFIGTSVSSFLLAIVEIKNNNTFLRICLIYLFYSILRMCQSFGWIGIVKIIGNWTPYYIHGRVMSFISISFLFGDVSVRAILGIMIEKYDYNWRQVLGFSAVITFVSLFPVLLILRNDPTKRGLPMPPENPDNAYASKINLMMSGDHDNGDNNAHHHNSNNNDNSYGERN